MHLPHSPGRAADVNMRSGGVAGDRTAKSRERNAVGAQITHQRLRFCRVGVQGNVKGIAVIEAEAIMCV